MERNVTINHDHELYVIEKEHGTTSLGFDVCLDRIERYMTELTGRGKLPERYMDYDAKLLGRGTMLAYDTYQNLLDVLRTVVEEQGEQAVSELSPQLTGLEDHRVQVVDKHGETRRFVVGMSTGWLPCHLEIKRRDSRVADHEYQTVTDLGRVR